MATPPGGTQVDEERAEPAGGADHWFALDQAAVVAKVGSDAERGLSDGRGGEPAVAARPEPDRRARSRRRCGRWRSRSCAIR